MSLLENIKESEGFRSSVYDDSLGIPTIGYGFAIKDLHLTRDDCDKILERKVAELKIRVHNKFPFIITLPESIQDVVIECCYQLGVTGFSKFKKTLAYLEAHEFEKAALEMLDSKWAKQTPNRAKKLSDIVKYAK
ncbi:MAG: putative endolysin [Prokaryotic dsDNA virus sp.]|nr:MAG: putative endolysin [Prokaryotic dsDNA virus sp.]|tara:strand:- start:9157 stop:9561 length:405 start_codon:yes stop_codon:yes gene_type:complete